MISAFGIDHDGEIAKRQRDPSRGDKAFGSGAKTAGVVGVGAAALLTRKKANEVGLIAANRMARRSTWSAQRAAAMPEGRLKRGRLKWSQKLGEASRKGPGGNHDVREWAGRGIVGGLAGGTAGGAVYGRKRLSAKENS